MSGKSGPPMAQFRPVLARIAYRFGALQVDFFQYRERRARGIIAWFLEVKKEIPCLSNQPVRRAVATLRPSAALCDGELGYCSLLPLFFPLYDPLAMRVATHHVLGKFERKIRIQTLGSSIEPHLRSTPQRTQQGVPWTPATYTPSSTTACLPGPRYWRQRPIIADRCALWQAGGGKQWQADNSFV